MDKNYQKKEVRRTEEGFYICDRCGGYFEEHEMSRGRYGVIGICRKCVGKAHSDGAKRREQKRNAAEQELKELRMEIADLKRQLSERNANTLEHVTPREMLIELKKRGYEGKLEYVSRKVIDLSKLE